MHNLNMTICISLLIAAVMVKAISSLTSAFRVRKGGISQLVNMGRYKIRAGRFWIGEAVGYFSLAIFLVVMYLTLIWLY